ncbi:adhesin-like protein [Methanobrevibacter ruminantium M1]|uniref:Adhesin-like protein n=1 Tax=Methanobrevibacter ruminantium (strain ATCC 35063 / DSM 1093 / JCM 13430 / OCM 146 / M1) TaxID=634498 RepID=D3E161_METRM|nr:adhesin-like protein [Methanobrevibacter ruminantium]ADC46344.1 adhesin-like protein [Methanobrevibacter ruminantium M1]
MIKKITILSVILILFLAVSTVAAIDVDTNDNLDDGSSSNSDLISSSSLDSSSSDDVSSGSSEVSSSDESLDGNNLSDGNVSSSDESVGADNLSDGNVSSSDESVGADNLSDDESSSDALSEELPKTETVIKADPINYNYASVKGLTINLTDSAGLALSNKTLTVKVSALNKTSNLTTNSKGQAIFKLSASVGSYDVFISFTGDESYAPSNASSKITIKKSSTKIKLSNIHGYLTISNYVSVTLLDSAGKPIKSKSVTIQVNKAKYNVKTDSKGIAKVKVANKIGTYSVNAKFSGDKNYYASSNSSKLTITKMKVYIKAPSVKYYMTNSSAPYLTINLTNVKGSPLAKKKVSVKIGKKTYTLKTNSQGIAKFKFTKKVSSYNCKINFKATSNFYGASVNSKMTIQKMPTSLKAPSVSINSTNYGKVLISLKDGKGKALKNTTVTVNVTELKKVFTLKTNASGVATFSFNGEKTFNLKIKYAGNKNYAASSVSSKINVKQIKVKLSDVIGASRVLIDYVNRTKDLPSNVQYNNYNFTVTQLTYLASKAVKNINNKNYGDIVLISVPKSYKSSGEIYDTVYKKDFVKIANSVVGSSYNYKNKEYVSYSIYKVPFKVYSISFAKVLNFYGNNKKLPNYSLFTLADFAKVKDNGGYNFYLTTDNIAGKKSDLNMLKSLAKTLKSMGYNAVIVGIGPDIHNVAYRYGCTGNNSVLLACFGGVDVGCIEEWAGDLGDLNGHSFVNSYQGAHVLGLWFTKPYGASVSLNKKVGIAWDADYGFPLNTPAKYMKSHNISYIETGTVANACKLLSEGKMGGPQLIS